MSERDWHDVWQLLTGHTGGGLVQHWIPEVIRALSPVGMGVPDVILIPAIRRVGDAGTKTNNDYSGIGLIDRLAQLQNPSHDQQELKSDFEKINDFLRSVIGNQTASIEIPYERDVILVHMDGRTLPLMSLGTGIHEVIIMASVATVLNGLIICIEEPELHLHPQLQKKLIRFLQDKTNNQYFISTHSAHLLDATDTAIFHVRYGDHGYSTIAPAFDDREKSNVCFDLGYRASDLLQANCIIWVEGPSDRIYLRHWIKSVDPNLIEGLHYSIMFYGGRLLSHLTADDPEVEDFISLRRLNRYISILIDSDRDTRGRTINKTKQRVRDEFDKGPGFAWITKGREIENYVAPETLEDSIKSIYPDFKKLKSTGQYDNLLSYVNGEGKLKKGLDKVKIAYQVASLPSNLEVLDLKQMTRKMVNFIYEANDIRE